jgi:predicted transcriptional regulator
MGADVMICCTRADTVITQECTKFKDGSAWPAERFKITALERSVVLRPEAQVIETDLFYSASQRKILRGLGTTYDGAATVKQLCFATGLPPSTAAEALEALRHKGAVSSRKPGGQRAKTWCITEKGRSAYGTTSPESNSGDFPGEVLVGQKELLVELTAKR